MIPFYCVVQKVCVRCDQKEFVALSESSKKTGDVKFADANVEPVDCCSYRQYVFENDGESVVDDLIDFIFEQTNSVWVAHNGSRFDTVFLLRNVLIKKNLVPHVVMNGNKVMMIIYLQESKIFFFKSLPLDPKDALFGGRTSPACLIYSAKENEKIMYLDFTSLYPSMQKKNIFPVGHLQIYVGNDECRKIDLKNVMGFVKCTVLPPRNLLFPVLPVRIEGKLIFPLCFACAKEKQQAWNHVETERYLCL